MVAILQCCCEAFHACIGREQPFAAAANASDVKTDSENADDGSAKSTPPSGFSCCKFPAHGSHCTQDVQALLKKNSRLEAELVAVQTKIEKQFKFLIQSVHHHKFNVVIRKVSRKVQNQRQQPSAAALQQQIDACQDFACVCIKFLQVARLPGSETPSRVH